MSWKEVLRRNFTDWAKLAHYLQLNPEQCQQIIQSRHFPLNLPLRLASKIEKGTLNDPILKQFLPTVAEQMHLSHYAQDAVGDRSARITDRLLHKYEGRVLLLCTGGCVMNCRYCFRQHYDYDHSGGDFAEELNWIRATPSIQEVILSGGDPLSLSNRTLEGLLRKLACLDHLRRIRFHTRVPIGIPERLDDGFLALLKELPQIVWFVIHANHPVELDDEVMDALKQLRQAGAVVLNQSVLLKGVNDNVDTLKALSEKLVNHGIFPYYLNQLDRVQGAAHFEVEEQIGIQLIADLNRQLPGYAVPRYVREIKGEPNKTEILLR